MKKPQKRQKTEQLDLMNNVMSLIHLLPNANGGTEPATTAESLSEIITSSGDPGGAKIEEDMKDAKFIKIVFPTVKEARNRAIVLALLTCKLHKARKTFVHLFTHANFSKENNSLAAYHKIRKMRQVYLRKSPQKSSFLMDMKSILAPKYIQAK